MNVLDRDGTQFIVNMLLDRIRLSEDATLASANKYTNDTLVDLTLDGRFAFAVDYGSGDLLYTITGDSQYVFTVNEANGQLEYEKEEG